MSWLKEIKNNLQQPDKLREQYEVAYKAEFARISPMVMTMLREIGIEWYGKIFFIKRFKIDAIKGVFFWGITRRGGGLDTLPQQMNIKLRLQDGRFYFAIDAKFKEGPTLTSISNDTSQEGLKQAIIDLIS